MLESNKILVGYCLDSEVSDVSREDAMKLTHLNIASGRIEKGEAVLWGNEGIKHILRLRDDNPKLKICMSFGGEYSDASMTQEGRNKIAHSLVKLIKDYCLDGIDLDWEFPCCGENGLEAKPEDKLNFTKLCQTIRQALDFIDGKQYLFTIAAGPDKYYLDSTEMDKVQQYLDHIYVMTYDMRGAFQVLTGHHSNLYLATGDIFSISTDIAARMFYTAGVPKNKIILGLAFYSRMWQGVPNRYNGHLQIARSRGDYGPVYHDLLNGYIDKNGYTRFWDDECKSPFLFNGEIFITYDDAQSIACKGDYVVAEGYGGLFYWEHSCDNTRTLLHAAYESLNRSIHSEGKAK